MENEEDGFTEYQAKVLALVRMISALISIFASTAMIILISKSTTRLTTTQNRLLVGLSSTDIVFSIATGLTSIPVPKGTPNMWNPIGSQTTCNIQGFLQVFGSMSTPLYNCSLCIFFLLKIRYNMNDEKIRTKVEPFFHIIALIIPLAFSFYCLFKEYYNPYMSNCYAADYPPTCSLSDDIPCERGDGFLKDGVVIFGYSLNALTPIVVFGSMITMFVTVQRQEARMAKFGIGSLKLKRGGGEGTSPASTPRRKQPKKMKSRYVRLTVYRGLAYSGAWFVTFIFPVINAIKNGAAPPRSSSDFPLFVLISIFHPLQGFLNFLVFIYPKVLVMRQADPNCSVCQLFSSFMSLFERRERSRHSMIIRSVQEIIDAGDDDIQLDGGGDLRGGDDDDDDDDEQQITGVRSSSSSAYCFGRNGNLMRLQNVQGIQVADSITQTLQKRQQGTNGDSEIVSEEEKVEIQ